MARINTYAIDSNVTDQDKWIGTDQNGGVTKNFTPERVAYWINSTNAVGIAGQTNFLFQTDLSLGRQSGSITFPNGSGDGTAFSTINDIRISKYGADGNLILDYLQNLLGTFVLICQVDDTNNFGVYRLDSLTQDTTETDFYNAVLTVQSSNGALAADEYYGVIAYPGSSLVSVTGLESIDEGNGAGWRLIGRDPDNYGNIGLDAIDFSNSDSISTEKGSVGQSSITFGNNNINQQTGTLMLGTLNNAEITDIYQGGNIITGYDIDVYGAVYNSFIGMYRGTVGVQGTNYVTNAIYQSVVVGDGANFYAGRDAGAIGGGLISGSTGVFTVGVANEDLTTTTSSYLTSQYNNYGPRFIVGCGTYNPVSQVATRQNGFVVMSDGTATFPIGNVGIGTTSPTTTLDVQGTVLVNNEIQFVNSSIRIFRSSDDMRFRTGNSDRMTINSLGNVGIGTTSPSDKLDVAGDIAINSSKFAKIDSSYTYLYKSNTNAVGIYLGGTGDQSNYYDNNSHYFRNSGGSSTKMIINSSGNVGIGVTAPLAKLHIDGGDIYLVNDGGEPRLVLGDSLSNGNWGYIQWKSANDRVDIGTSGTAALSVLESGNVGIGTTSPIYELDVNGSVLSNEYRLNLSATEQRALSSAGTDSIQVGDAGVNEIRFKNAAGTSAIINSSGNVGIGTTSPSASLSIGDGLTSNVNVHINKRDNNDAGYYIVNEGNDLGRKVFVRQSTGEDAEIGTNQNNDLSLITNNTTRLFIDGVSGNVGIGTTSPTDLLHLEGASTPTLKIVDTTNTTITELYSNDFDTYLANESSGRVFIRTGGSNGFVVDSAGDVGIGTTNPIYKLDIQAESPAIRIRDISDANSFLVGADNSGGYLGMFTNDSLRVYTNSLERMRISDTGNVGIGTTNPTHRLYVQGNNGPLLVTREITTPNQARIGIGENNPSGALTFGSYSDRIITGAASLRFANGARMSELGTTRLAFQSGVGYYFYPTGTNPSGDVYGVDIRHLRDSAVNTNDAVLEVNNSSNSSLMLVRSDGNVGIGTTSPSQLLDISSAVGSTEFTGHQIFMTRNGNNEIYAVGASSVLALGTNGAEKMRINSSGNVGIGTTSPSSKLHINGGTGSLSTGLTFGDGDTGIWEAADDILRFSTSSSTRMLMDSSGNVGIGTTTPRAKLEIQDSTQGALMLSRPSETGYAMILGSSGLGFEFKTYNSGEIMAMKIANTGNVGIGTTSPAKKLEVDGTVHLGSSGNDVSIGASNSSVIFMLRAGYNYIQASEATGALVFRTGGTSNRMIIDPNGNVGIGTLSPAAKLDVDGNIKLGATTGRQLMFGEDKYGAIRLGNNTVIGGNQAVDIRTGNASVTSQSSRVFINQTGNVGVGTTSPVATLDVNGSIKVGGSLLAPAANTVGAMRYRTDSNNSYVEMIMQTGASTYAWVIIKQNTW